MNLYLEGDIDSKLVDRFLFYLNRLSPEEKMVIYFNSGGGKVDDIWVFLDVIEKNKDRIILIANGIVASAAFTIFFRATCERRLNPEVVGMAHFTFAELELDQTGKPKTEYGKFLLKEMKRQKKGFIEFLKELGLTNSELADIKKGEEVYFANDRMTEFLNKSNAKQKEK